MLLSIALLPLAAPGFWHRHAGHVAPGGCAAFRLPFVAAFGFGSTFHATHLLAPTLFLVVCLLALFFAIDTRLVRASVPAPAPARCEPLGIDGAVNLLPLAARLGLVLLSGAFRAVAEGHGVRMPGFFGDMAWSGIILTPLFATLALIWCH